MRRGLAILLPILAFTAQAAQAQTVVTYEEVVIYEDVVEEEVVLLDTGTARFVDISPAPVPRGVATYGPFRVIDGTRAALVDATDERSPGAFVAMLRDHPGIAMLEMIECPGTDDDQANLRLGHMIRARGLATHVPRGGSVRSGAVELFLAGVRRSAAEGAEFAVHSWLDQDGREPGDYAPDDMANREYVDYYRAMGMTEAQARAFYDMTNSVHHSDARWLTTAEMGQWVALDGREVGPGGRDRGTGALLASLDSNHRLR